MTTPERRATPPLSRLMIDCPMSAQPPMPPVSEDATLAKPWPMHSAGGALRAVHDAVHQLQREQHSIAPPAMVAAYGRITTGTTAPAATPAARPLWPPRRQSPRGRCPRASSGSPSPPPP